MKISLNQNCGQMTFITESLDDLYILGRLAVKLKSAHVHKPERDKRELTADVADVLSELCK